MLNRTKMPTCIMPNCYQREVACEAYVKAYQWDRSSQTEVYVPKGNRHIHIYIALITWSEFFNQSSRLCTIIKPGISKVSIARNIFWYKCQISTECQVHVSRTSASSYYNTEWFGCQPSILVGWATRGRKDLIGSRVQPSCQVIFSPPKWSNLVPYLLIGHLPGPLQGL